MYHLWPVSFCVWCVICIWCVSCVPGVCHLCLPFVCRWETDDNYCKAVKQLPLYKTHDYRLLDIIDTAIFDYLIGNADRHHYETFSNVDKGMLVILDNGKRLVEPECKGA